MIAPTETQAEEYATEQPADLSKITPPEQPLPDIPPKKEVPLDPVEEHLPEEYLKKANVQLADKVGKTGGFATDEQIKHLAKNLYEKDLALERQAKEAEPYTEELQQKQEPVKPEDYKQFVEGPTPDEEAPTVPRIIPEEDIPEIVKDFTLTKVTKLLVGEFSYEN